MFVNPEKTAESFELLPGMQVADLGSGSGLFSLAAAKMVGEKGRVYAVDIQKEILSKTKKDAENNGLSNVEIIWGDVEDEGGSKLADQSMDAVVASNILFQVEDRGAFVKEVARILKNKNGKVFVIDWKDSFGGIGPEPSVLVPPEKCKKMFLENGFEFYKEFPTGLHHYGLAFKKSK